MTRKKRRNTWYEHNKEKNSVRLKYIRVEIGRGLEKTRMCLSCINKVM